MKQVWVDLQAVETWGFRGIFSVFVILFDELNVTIIHHETKRS